MGPLWLIPWPLLGLLPQRWRWGRGLAGSWGLEVGGGGSCGPGTLGLLPLCPPVGDGSVHRAWSLCEGSRPASGSSRDMGLALCVRGLLRGLEAPSVHEHPPCCLEAVSRHEPEAKNPQKLAARFGGCSRHVPGDDGPPVLCLHGIFGVVFSSLLYLKAGRV